MCVAECGAELVAKAGRGAEDDLEGMLMDKGGEFVSGQKGSACGTLGGALQCFGVRGVESLTDCAVLLPQESPGTLPVLTMSLQ